MLHGQTNPQLLQFSLLITGGYMMWQTNPLAAIMAAITAVAPDL